jgi:hypothetical protein
LQHTPSTQASEVHSPFAPHAVPMVFFAAHFLAVVLQYEPVAQLLSD